ncbi:unannotated protein [freshwater metagenome]|uniref:Unannotated protein n=1 Tax=freshwater metagenome TaxID=449393 RepID=A0A6J6IAC5_9ZZZZ
MLGGINNELFLQAFAGFLVFPVIILLLRWTFPSKKDPEAKAEIKRLKKELRALRKQ